MQKGLRELIAEARNSPKGQRQLARGTVYQYVRRSDKRIVAREVFEIDNIADLRYLIGVGVSRTVQTAIYRRIDKLGGE